MEEAVGSGQDEREQLLKWLSDSKNACFGKW